MAISKNYNFFKLIFHKDFSLMFFKKKEFIVLFALSKMEGSQYVSLFIFL